MVEPGGELHEVAAARLRRDAQRYTSGRRRLVDVLEGAAGPLTLPEVITSDPGLAQSSAYRNLRLLEQAGVVHRIVTSDDHARYELAEDLTEHHHHLICRSCGRVDDFTVTPDLEAELERALTTAARRHRYAVDHHRLDLIGTCATCSS